MLCGTDPLPELFRAKRYKIKHKFFTKSEFQFIMRNLPEEVSEDDIEEMFDVADTDKDGKIGFQVMKEHDCPLLICQDIHFFLKETIL